MLPFNAVPYHTVPYHTVASTVQCSTVPYRALPYRVLPYRTIGSDHYLLMVTQWLYSTKVAIVQPLLMVAINHFQ
jgi:hypothetical protein